MNQLQSENINELMSALSKAQGQITPALKDSANPFFKSRYADLSSIWEACRAPLSKNGLAVTQSITTNEAGQMILVSTLGHSSGQWMRSYLPILCNKMEPQPLGSSISYMRRYSLAALVGVSPSDADDDGESAQGRPGSAQNQSKSAPTIQVPIETLNFEETEDLISIIGNDTEFRNRLLAHYKIKAIGDLSRSQFVHVREKALANRDFKKQNVESVDMSQ